MAEYWCGSRYKERRLFLLGESAYSWLEENDVVHPSARHAIELVEEVLESRSVVPFMTKLTRALTCRETPAKNEIEAAWEKVAFTNYVPGTVGQGARVRPTLEMWKSASDLWRPLLETLKPTTVIVLGKIMWSLMPDPDIWLTDDVQGYRQGDGSVAMCWAVNHPSAGLSWRRLAQLIAFAADGKIVEC